MITTSDRLGPDILESALDAVCCQQGGLDPLRVCPSMAGAATSPAAGRSDRDVALAAVQLDGRAVEGVDISLAADKAIVRGGKLGGAVGSEVGSSRQNARWQFSEANRIRFPPTSLDQHHWTGSRL